MNLLGVYKEFLHLLGFGLCHQMPERSFSFGGVQLPVCARCSGIYIGIIITLIMLFTLYRGAQRSGLPGIAFYFGAALATVSIGIDGIGSYMGLYHTNNFMRVLTGIMFGAAMGPVIYAILVESLAKHSSSRRILNDARSIALWALSVPIGLAVAYGLFPLLGMLAAGLMADMIITTFWLICLVLVGLVPRFRQSVSGPRDLIAPLLWALPVACGIIVLCAALQLWAMRTLIG
jgi:uncharacterized membrane protein